MLGLWLQVWAVPTTMMQCEWLGERVATVDVDRAIANVINNKEDAGWGPNAVFRCGAGRQVGQEVRQGVGQGQSWGPMWCFTHLWRQKASGVEEGQMPTHSSK